MKISDLENGKQYMMRKGRAGEEDVNWEPWHRGTLFVQRCEKGKHKGEVAILGPYNGAEYGLDSWCPQFKLFLVEDYYFQIEGLEGP